MMKEIESLEFEELAEDQGMDVLWQKLRYELQCTIKGLFLKELTQKDAEFAKRVPPVTVGGRQLAWMMRRKFDVDLTEQNVFTEREVHDLTRIGFDEYYYLEQILSVAQPDFKT